MHRAGGVGLVRRRLWCTGIVIIVSTVCVCPIRLWRRLEGPGHAAGRLSIDIHGVRHGGGGREGGESLLQLVEGEVERVSIGVLSSARGTGLGEPAAAARRPWLGLLVAAGAGAGSLMAAVVGPARLGGGGFLAWRGTVSRSGFIFVFVAAGRLGVLIGLGKESHLREVLVPAGGLHFLVCLVFWCGSGGPHKEKRSKGAEREGVGWLTRPSTPRAAEEP